LEIKLTWLKKFKSEFEIIFQHNFTKYQFRGYFDLNDGKIKKVGKWFMI